jgi:uncharacterized protein (DUF4415 family)
MDNNSNAWESPDFDDNPEWTDDDFRHGRPAAEVLPPEIVAQLVRKPGRPALPDTARKRSVGIRLSPDVLDALKSTGPNWQRRAIPISSFRRPTSCRSSTR